MNFNKRRPGNDGIGLGDLPPDIVSRRGQDRTTPPSTQDQTAKPVPFVSVLQQARYSQFVTTLEANVPTRILPDNAKRCSLIIQNKSGTGTLYLGFGAITGADDSLELAARGFAEPNNAPANEIWLFSTTSIKIYVAEGYAVPVKM